MWWWRSHDQSVTGAHTVHSSWIFSQILNLKGTNLSPPAYFEVIGSVIDPTTIKMYHCIDLGSDIGSYRFNLTWPLYWSSTGRLGPCKWYSKAHSRSSILFKNVCRAWVAFSCVCNCNTCLYFTSGPSPLDAHIERPYSANLPHIPPPVSGTHWPVPREVV